jgi:hypothetical protein
MHVSKKHFLQYNYNGDICQSSTKFVRSDFSFEKYTYLFKESNFQQGVDNKLKF